MTGLMDLVEKLKTERSLMLDRHTVERGKMHDRHAEEREKMARAIAAAVRFEVRERLK
jgi:hypothetical protein